MEPALKEKYTLLKNRLAGFGSAAVAFSGGVDSTLLLKTAYSVLGDRITAFIGTSSFQLPSERTEALSTAQKIGCRTIVVNFDLASDDIFCENRSDRCYYCKKLIYAVFQEKMGQFNCVTLMDGTNLDDSYQDRPGAFAVQELRVETPLKDVQLTKKEIRLISRELGLSTWNKFSASCLATRIQTGKRITLDDIEIVAEIENLLTLDGFLGSRLKIGKNCAIVSLTEGDHTRFLESSTRRQIKNILKTKGFQQLFLDLSGREGILT